MATNITSTAPRSGAVEQTNLYPTSTDEVAQICESLNGAFGYWRSTPRSERADTLDAIADGIDAERTELVATADRETALGEARLTSEIARAAFQFRFFADAIRDGAYLEVAIDHAAETAIGPAPDVRRRLIPIGPVAVFGASNFPFAFSVLGGDTASALAAGSPVAIKTHESHPLTSALSFRVLSDAIQARHGPEHLAAIVYGLTAGVDLLRHPAIQGAGFTGSLSGATALQNVIGERPDPIPFFGELSSSNPVLVTAEAADGRHEQIADGFFDAMTGSGGQLCTKPGILLVPAGQSGDRLLERLSERVAKSDAFVVLNDRIRRSFGEIRGRLMTGGAAAVAEGRSPQGPALSVSAQLLTTTAEQFTRELAEECFGPLAIAVRYRGMSDALRAIGRIPGSLTATLHAEPGELGLGSILDVLEQQAGRIIFNGFPTGVRVSWAQHHGGPWPATNTQDSSVGATAIRRWLRPVAWQNVPMDLLPEELRDAGRTTPSRVDGRLRHVSER